MRQNKAARTNKNFLTATMLLAIVVLGSVSILWYVAVEAGEQIKNFFSNPNYVSQSVFLILGEQILGFVKWGTDGTY